MNINTILIIGLLLAFFSCHISNQSNDLNLSAEQLVQKIDNDELLLDFEELKDKISSSDSEYQLIDIRPAVWFEKGHLENAINIPLNTVLEKQNKSFWTQDEPIKILYGDVNSPVESIQFLLYSKGYKNIKALGGSFNIPDTYNDLTYLGNSETPKFDFVAVFDEINEKNKKEFLPLPVKKPKTIVLKPKPVKKVEVDEEEEEEEGC